MFRLKKLLGIILIFGIVFFIICDEKGYKIGFENNHIVFNKIEKKSDFSKNSESKSQLNFNAVYKNSNLIRINPQFKNPQALRNSDGIDPQYLAKLEKKKKREEERKKNQEKTYTGPSIISINDRTISSVFQGMEPQDNTGISKQKEIQDTRTEKQEVKQDTATSRQETIHSTGIERQEIKKNTGTIEPEKPVIYYLVKKYDYDKHSLNLSNGVKVLKVKIDNYTGKENVAINIQKGKESEPIVLYKNSNRIKLYPGFENIEILRNSAGMDEEFIAKQENKVPTIVSLSDNDIEPNSLQNNNGNNNSVSIGNIDEHINSDLENYTQENFDTESQAANTENNIEYTDYEITFDTEGNNTEILNNNEMDKGIEEVTYKVEKYQPTNHFMGIKESAEVQSTVVNNEPEEIYVNIDKPELSKHSVEISEGKLIEQVLVKINKYKPSNHVLNMKKGKIIQHSFVVEDNESVEEIDNTENGLSNPMLESLLANEEIDINTLESENDEFLQKVFEQTKDRDVMNLIVETYLNEYQFVKAKRFIENLPDMYRNELKPSLNLRVTFNSFSLSSKSIDENLTSIVQDYSSKNEISEEDKNRYMGVIALMNRNYDRFFEISAGFSSEKNKAFASKLQGYKDQIAKQMGMPEYYFDTLVSLELFNQGLFQPAKVLALYSLQQNSSYILPYQVLAYANFLTNSWDTSVEYLKKLVDIDSNNAEKYRFLIGVASYRDEKYEQSVVMLAMIKDETLRLDTQRYLINNYIKLDQKNRLISTRNKLLGSENLVASDFYTYFYEAFFHPYSEGLEYQLYAFDTELANKMLRVCAITLPDEERAVCTYGTIGRNIALGQFDGIEQYLLNLVAEYPQGYLYQALGDYYVQQGNLEKAKVYLLKAISLTQKKSERSQIKKLLQDTM